MKHKVFIVGKDWSMYTMFIGMGWEVVEHIDEASLIQFVGGADISPSLYGASKHPYTHTNPVREEDELWSYDYATTNSIPMGGICRGGQLINALKVCSMFQHVTGHGVDHYMKDVRTDELVFTTSVHHQMVKLTDKATLIAVAEGISSVRQYMSGDDIITDKGSHVDPEAWYYDGAVCVQGHPEYDVKGGECQEYYFKLLKEFFNV